MPGAIFLGREDTLAIAEARADRKGILQAFRQPDALPVSGSLNRVSHHCNQRCAACSTSAISAGAICNAGARTIPPRWRTEGSKELLTVRDACGHHLAEAEASAVQRGALFGSQDGKRILAQKGRAVVTRQRLLGQHTQNCCPASTASRSFSGAVVGSAAGRMVSRSTRVSSGIRLPSYCGALTGVSGVIAPA